MKTCYVKLFWLKYIFYLFKENHFLEAYSKHTFFEILSLSRYLYSIYIHMFVEKFVYADVLMRTLCSLRVRKSARFCPPTHVTTATSQPTHSCHQGEITAHSLTSPWWHHSPPTHVTAATSQPTHSRHRGEITAHPLTSPRWHHSSLTHVTAVTAQNGVTFYQPKRQHLTIKQVLIRSGIQIPLPVSIWVPFDICLPISFIMNYVLSLIGVK